MNDNRAGPHARADEAAVDEAAVDEAATDEAAKPHRRLWRRLTWRDSWDVLMIYLALLNLGLIVFDLTYLWLRPVYVRNLPVLVRLYDPVKGIELHRTTEAYLHLVDDVAAGLDGPPQTLAPGLADLRQMSLEMLEENPFVRSGQERSLVRLTAGMRTYLKQREPGMHPEEIPAPDVYQRFWSLQPKPELLGARVEYFRRELAPLLVVNYYRPFDLDGELVDHFWLLDLPFLVIFSIEFYGRWLIAVRRRTFAKWWLFPIFNWYDFLGIVPLREFRIFRLFRIASLYIRLKRSDRTGVGSDPVSRLVRHFANIISEEISDLVAVRILDQTQEEIRAGTHRTIIRAVAEHHRAELAVELTTRSRELLANERFRAQARDFLDANLERATDNAPALRHLPLPRILLRPLVQVVGQAVFDTLADTLRATLESDEGRQILEEALDESVEDLATGVTEGELDAVVTEIVLDAIEQVKAKVQVRTWALPDS